MTTFSAALCLAVGIIMILNNHSFFHKALPYAMLFLGFFGIVDLLNLVINHVYFYDIFKIYYTDIQTFVLRIVSLILPASLIYLFFDKLEFKFKYLSVSRITILLILSLVLSFSVLESSYHKLAYLIYYFSCFLIFLFLIHKNKTYLKDNNVFVFLLVIFCSFVFFLVATLIYFINNDTLFSEFFGLLPALDYDISDTFIKFIFNLRLIVIPTAFLFSPKLLFGSYYFESKPKPDKYQKPKNHWSNIRLKKIVTVDYKTFNDLEEHSLNIIDKLIKIEAKFINNTVAYDNIEDVSQLINEKTHHVEFIFKYHNILSFSKYILKLKMLRAAFLIEEGYLINNSVNDLSALSGYNSRSAFFTKFKEINGFSPTRY